MSFEFEEHDGLISITINGKLPTPFVYIDAKAPPPWFVEPLRGGRVGPFWTLDAAKAALILALGATK